MIASFEDHPKPPPFLLSFLTFSIITLELLLTRLFGYICYYHFTAAAISTALLGLGLGAFLRLRYLASVQSARLWMFGYTGLAAGFPIVIIALWFLPYPTTLMMVSFCIFLVGGILISHYYDLYQSRLAYKTYFYDLAGAATACVVFPLLIAVTGATGLLIFLSILSSAVAFILFRFIRQRFIMLLPIISVTLLSGIFLSKCPDVLAKAIRRSDKPLSTRLRDGGRIIDIAWSAVGRSDLYEEPEFRNLKWIYNEGMASTVLLRRVTQKSQEEFLQKQFPYFPLTIRQPKTALFIGPGGGLEIQLARLAGVRSMTAVELNPAIIRLVRKYEEFAGPVYDQADIQLIIDEGRKYLVSHPGKYDFIQMANVGTGAAQSGSLAMIEGFLFTKEAVESYLGQLTQKGLMAVFDDSPLRILRQCLTDIAVLEQKKSQNARTVMEHLCILEDTGATTAQYRFLIIMSNVPFARKETVLIAERSKASGYRSLWIPGLASEKPFHELSRLDLTEFVSSLPYDVSPCSDDKPFYFNHFKRAKELLKLGWPLFSISLVAFLGFLLTSKSSLRADLYSRYFPNIALLLGIGFMFLELGLLQKLALVAGGPTQTLSILLFGLLLYCGLGSRLLAWKQKNIGIDKSCLLAALVSALSINCFQFFYQLPNISSTFIRILIALAAIGPLGLVLGVPFPTLLSRVPNNDQFGLARLWGANGFGSVIGACAYLYSSLLLGIRDSMLIGSVIYLGAALLSLPLRKSTA